MRNRSSNIGIGISLRMSECTKRPTSIGGASYDAVEVRFQGEEVRFGGETVYFGGVPT